MGGQNHQPTNRIQLIAPSAWLSQKLGEGFASVFEANSRLEDAIIIAMDRLYVDHLIAKSPDTAVRQLEDSVAALERSLERVSDIETGFDNLLAAAAREGYTGNPLAPSVSTMDLKTRMERHLVLPAANETAWNAIESRVRELNVLGTLRWEREQFDQLREPTKALTDVMRQCIQIAKDKGPKAFIEAVECNGVAMRQRYAQVFSLWNYLHAMFLYSALIMTELFYRSYEYTPLSEWEPGESKETRVIEAASA